MESRDLVVKDTALPATFEEIKGMAEAFFKSGMFSDVKAQAQAIVKIQAGRELGLPPVYSMQNINMIRDRLATSANTLALLVKRTGRYNYRIKEHTDTVCLITFYESENGKWVEVGESKFTIDDAKRANLVKPDSGWVKFPRAMLFSRAISQGARIYAPDAIGGVYTDEELRSIPPKPEEEKVTTENAPTAPDKPQDAKPDEVKPQPDKSPVEKPKRNPASIIKLADLNRALHDDFGLQPVDQLKELNIKAWSELSITPAEAYRVIASTRQ